jgi:phospholipid transport system substrate-binding protein
MTRNPKRRKRPQVLSSIACGLMIGALMSAAPVPAQGLDDAAGAAAGSTEALAAAVAVVSRLQAALVAAAALDGVDERFEFLRAEIDATHDLEFIGRLTVRRQWRDFTEPQRSDFADRFERLSVMSYAAAFRNVAADSFTPPVGEAMSAERVQVKSGILRADGSTVPLEYLLQNEAAGWRIVNVIADGVSDVALKRAEYQALFDSGGFEALVGELEAQTRELAESDQSQPITQSAERL